MHACVRNALKFSVSLSTAGTHSRSRVTMVINERLIGIIKRLQRSLGKANQTSALSCVYMRAAVRDRMTVACLLVTPVSNHFLFLVHF